jgi:hypothetical protein
LAEVSDLRTASIIIALMMEAVRNSETSVNFNVTTRRYISEDSKLHTRRRENLKSRINELRDLSNAMCQKIDSHVHL